MRRLVILHVEDNREDATLLARACRAANLQADVCGLPGGGEAIAYLKGEGPFAQRSIHPFPDLIILDLKMPGMDGFEFLRWLRQASHCPSLPVLVFTGSQTPDDRVRALADGASGYFVKPVDFESLVNFAESFKTFGRIQTN